MPNFDGGHYFLTALVPIMNDRIIEHDGVLKSPIDMLRSALARMPAARQSRVAEEIGLNSPFARASRTHLSRFVVIDDVTYNGRERTDAIKVWALGPNPVIPQKQDRLSCPFLLFVSDFDAASGQRGELASYLTELWSTMEAELRDVFRFCVAFDTVTDAASFVRYIERCQIETTMPFNDYWPGAPPFRSLQNLYLTLFAVGAVAGAWLLGLLGADGWSWLRAGAGLVAGLVSALVPIYIIVMVYGQRPLPTAPHSDLPSVLKALYLQQRLTEFVISVQGEPDEVIHTRFGAFIANHQPGNVHAATQVPGVIRS